MRAMRVHAFGEPPRLTEIPAPVPAAGEALLRVRACGVNFADTLMVAGKYQEKPPLPLTPGMEVCGEVAALGPGTEGLAVGQRVASFVGHGGFADYLAVPAGRCVPVPDAMPDEEVAGFLIAYGTSHVALAHRARLHPGERLVVLGASGGIGLTAVELGKLMGATVIAVARGPEKLAVARSAGADHLIDAGEDIRAGIKALGGADVLYDPVGGEQFDAAFRACNREARILPLSFAGGAVPAIPANIVMVKDMTVLGLYWGGYVARHPRVLADSLGALFAWYALGRLRPHVSHVLPLEEANAALDLLRTRAAMGKVVVRIAE